MKAFWLLLCCALGMTLVQDAVPGVALYHDGWYATLIAACIALAAYERRKRLPALAFSGAALVALSGIGSSLTGPATQTIRGAPGTTIRNPDYGALSFPFGARGGFGLRYHVNSITWSKPRAVVRVDAADLRGNHVTVTQPSNASFLSPVLLMTQRTTIAGMNVAYDTFSVPALDANVKAVLFTPAQAAQLHAGSGSRPAVLFVVADPKGTVARGGIGIVSSGARKRIDGMLLSARVERYPAIVAASAPNAPILVLGLVLFAAGVLKARSAGKGERLDFRRRNDERV